MSPLASDFDMDFSVCSSKQHPGNNNSESLNLFVLEVHRSNPLGSRSHSQTALMLFWVLLLNNTTQSPQLVLLCCLLLHFVLPPYHVILSQTAVYKIYIACTSSSLTIDFINFHSLLEDGRSSGSIMIFPLHFLSSHSESHEAYIRVNGLPIEKVDRECLQKNVSIGLTAFNVALKCY